MNRVQVKNQTLSFINEGVLLNSSIQIEIDKLNVPDNDLKVQLLRWFELYRDVLYVAIAIEDETLTYDSEIVENDEIDIPERFKNFRKKNQAIKKLIKRDLDKAPVRIMGQNLSHAELLNNKNEFMAKIFGKDWKDLPVVKTYLKHGEFLGYTSEALLFLHKRILPAIIIILQNIRPTNNDIGISELISKLQEERKIIEHAMIARLQNTIRKKDANDDDLLFSVNEQLASPEEPTDSNKQLNEAKNHFKKVTSQVSNGLQFHSEPHKKMTGRIWVKFNKILANSSDTNIQKEYDEFLKETNKNSVIQMRVIPRPYGKVIIPWDMRQDFIPNSDPSGFWHPGDYTRRHFFEKNHHRIQELNLKINRVKECVEKLKAPLKIKDLLNVIDEMDELYALIKEALENVEVNKNGGILKLFYSDTNRMLDNWKDYLFKIHRDYIFPKIEEVLAKKLLEQNSGICWDEEFDLLPQDIDKIVYRFLYPVGGFLSKTGQKGHVLYQQIYGNASQIYSRQNIIQNFVRKIEAGAFKRLSVKDKPGIDQINKVFIFVLKFTEDNSTREALNMLQKLLLVDGDVLKYKKNKIITILLPLFKKHQYPKNAAELFLKVIEKTYISPIVNQVESNDFKLLKLLNPDEADQWVNTRSEKRAKAVTFLNNLFTKTEITDTDLLEADIYIGDLRAISSANKPYLENWRRNRVEAYLNSYQGENSTLQSLFTSLEHEDMIKEYGKKRLNYLLKAKDYKSILHEEFFIKNCSVLEDVFLRAIESHLNHLNSVENSEIDEDLIEIFNHYLKLPDEHSLYKKIDDAHLNKLYSLITKPIELLAYIDRLLRSKIRFPTTKTGTSKFLNFVKNSSISWSEPLHALIVRKGDKALSQCSHLKWLDAILVDERLADKYKENFLAYHSYELLMNHFGKDNIKIILQKIQVLLQNEKITSQSVLEIVDVFLSETILSENNFEHLRRVLSDKRRKVRHQISQNNIFLELKKLTVNTSELIESIKQYCNLIEDSAGVNDIEEAKSIQKAIEQYLNYVIEKMMDPDTQEVDEKHYINILKKITTEIPPKYFPTLEKLSKLKIDAFTNIKELFKLKEIISHYAKKSRLSLDFDLATLNLISFVPKDQLLKIKTHLTRAINNIKLNGDPLKNFLLVILKAVNQVINNIQVTSEEQGYIQFFESFKTMVMSMKDLCMHINTDQIIISSEEFKKTFDQSPYAQPQHDAFWIKWLKKVNKAGHSEKVSWLNQKYLPEINVTVELAIDSNPQLTTFRNAFEKLKGRELEDFRVISKALISYGDNNAIPNEDYKQLYRWCSQILKKFEKTFVGYNLPVVSELQSILKNEKIKSEIIYDFSFINSHRLCEGGLIDGLLLNYYTASISNHALPISAQIDDMIKNIAYPKLKQPKRNQLEIYENIKTGKILPQSLLDMMQANYYKAVFKIQSILLIDTLNNEKVSKNGEIFASQEFPPHLLKIIRDKLYECEVNLLNVDLKKTVEEIQDCWHSIRKSINESNATKDGDQKNKSANNIVDKFMKEKQVEKIFEIRVESTKDFAPIV